MSDLRTTASNVLAANHIASARLSKSAGSVVVRGIRSASAAWALRNLPGVEWVALGVSTGPSVRSITDALVPIARNYLARGTTFRVIAEAADDAALESDIAGAATSRVLDEFRETRVDETGPKVVFHVTVDSSAAVVGVGLYSGVGGTPTSKSRTAFCLVSGGTHSSVVAWMTVRAGYSVALLHVFQSEDAIREVARLYAELSQRMDPSALTLTVLFPRKSADPGKILRLWMRRLRNEVVFSGAHAECGNARLIRLAKVVAPLYLLSEERFRAINHSLGLRGDPSTLGESRERRGRGVGFRAKSFGGKRADEHGVLDALLS